MNFGEAIEKARSGEMIKRSGWNGKEQFVCLAEDITFRVRATGERVYPVHNAIGNNALAFYGTSGWQIGWLATQADMLADDWEVRT